MKTMYIELAEIIDRVVEVGITTGLPRQKDAQVMIFCARRHASRALNNFFVYGLQTTFKVR